MEQAPDKRSAGMKERFFLFAIIVYVFVALAFIANWYGGARMSHQEHVHAP
jgi:hypothetical protein